MSLRDTGKLRGQDLATRATPEMTNRAEPTKCNHQIPGAKAMPYFVYKITPPLTLTYIDTKDQYKDARALVRSMRLDQPAGQDVEYRMVFAKGQGEAEKLLSTPRDERVIGED